MNISILCSDMCHPVYSHLQRWCTEQSSRHNVLLVNSIDDLLGGDLLFLISCNEIVPYIVRGRYRASLVVHASDLPEGRGWSPLVWQILGGRNRIAVTLLEADDCVDSGAIWQKRWLEFDGTELYDEINESLFSVELELMNYAVDNMDSVDPQVQDKVGASWYPRRTPDLSRIDVHRPLAEQFDLLRVADPERYPAYFDYRGAAYEIFIKRRNKQ